MLQIPDNLLASNVGWEPLIQTVVALLFCLVGRLVSQRLVVARAKERRARYLWTKWLRAAWVFLASLLVTFIWFPAVESLATFFGLLSAGIAVAMHDSVSNLAGWAFILGRAPFQVGDRIEIGGIKGDVIDTGVFHFTLLEVGNWIDANQSNGRIVLVPNGVALREKIANDSAGMPYLWLEIPVLITFESDWQRAKEILAQISQRDEFSVAVDARAQLENSGDKYLMHYGYLTPIVYLTVRDSGVLLTIRMLAPVRKSRVFEQKVWEAVLEDFEADDAIVELAYPTARHIVT